MKQFLSQLVMENGSSKSSKLSSLNCVTKLCSNIPPDTGAKELAFEAEEVFCW